MKSFLSSFFASLLAFIVSLVLFFFVLMGIISVTLSSSSSNKEKKIEENSVLTLNLSDEISEITKDKFSLDFIKKDNSSSFSVLQVIQAIQKAKNDSKIKGIILYYSGLNVSLSNLEEIRNELEDFKKNEKFIYAYGDELNIKNTFVASVADQVFLSPVSNVFWKGLGTRVLFFKDALEKLEVEMQIFYQGKYKSATEPYRNNSMSEESKFQMKEIINHIFKYMLETICASKNIPYTALLNSTSNLNISNSYDALRLHIVDQVGTIQQFEQAIKSRLGLKEDKEISLVKLDDYVIGSENSSHSNKIAIIYAEGTIMDGKGGRNTIEEKSYLKMIKTIEEDDNIKAVVLRINSPGGEYKASYKISEALKKLRISKPIIVSMSSLAASGGYYIASDVDSIFANKMSITGSIGIFAMIPNVENLLKNKLGIAHDGVESIPNSNFDIFAPLSETQKLYIERIIKDGYNDFKKHVSIGRNIEIEIVEEVAQGRVWNSSDAKDNFLIDGIGGLFRALESAKSKSGLKEYSIVEYPEKQNIIESIMDNLSMISQNGFANYVGGKTSEKILNHVQDIESMGYSIQARLPYNYYIE